MRYEPPNKPASVTWALRLFWLSILLGCAKLGRALLLSAGDGGYSLTIFAFLAIYPVMALTALYINMGASWARNLMLALFVIGVLPALPIVFAYFVSMPLAGVMTLGQVLTQGLGLYMVFREPAASWFIRPRLG